MLLCGAAPPRDSVGEALERQQELCHCSSVEQTSGIVGPTATATATAVRHIRDLRRQAGWSVQQLADACAAAGMESLTRSTLAKIESGIRDFLTVDELVALADVLGLHPADLLAADIPHRAHDDKVALAISGRRTKRNRAGTAICPYCLSRFETRNILFRCRAGVSRPGRPRCEQDRDPIMEFQIPVGPLFRGSFRQTIAECPNCGIGTTIQVCPLCHSELPLGYAQSIRNLVAIVGARAVGKTIYITSLLHELRASVGERLKISAAPLDDSTSRRYLTDLEEPLFVKGELLHVTNVYPSPQPLVFDLAWQRRRNAKRGMQRNSLVLYDSAGESVYSRKGVGGLEYLKQADGIIFAVDSSPIAEFAGAKIGSSYESRDAILQPGPLLGSIAQVIRSQTSSGDLVDIPLAVTFMKADLLRGMGLIPDEESFFSRDRHLQQIGDSNTWAQSGFVASIVNQVDKGELQRVIDSNFSNYELFAVSALGAPPAIPGRKVRLPVEPLRVTDPLMWIFDQLQPSAY